MLCLYDSQTNMIYGHVGTGTLERLIEATRRDCSAEDILARVLRQNEAMFVPDAGDPQSHCDSEWAARVGLKSFYAVPLVAGDELIGTLLVDPRPDSELAGSLVLILQALAGQLAMAISRLRHIKRGMETLNQVMSSSRFIVAETLSAMAVHSLGHRIDQILRELSKDLKRREIRERRVLNEKLTRWMDTFRQSRSELEEALKFVRAPDRAAERPDHDLHDLIQPAIAPWFDFLMRAKCSLTKQGSSPESVMPTEGL